MKLIEIFRPGKQTAMSGEVIEFSEADLRATADAYDPNLHEAPLVVGHPKTDDPAYGWVQSVSYADVLGAVPHQVDTAFAEMVNAGRFKKVSASFYKPDSPNNPKPGVYYLRHVGFLGAQPPAVKGLKSASFAASDDGVIEFGDWADVQNASLWRKLREFIIEKFGSESADKAVPDYMLQTLEDSARATDPKTVNAFAEPDTQSAIKWLKAAIALHEKHMAGTAPTTGPTGEKSQQKMMDQMTSALAALTGDDTKQSMDMSEPNPQETKMDKQKEQDIAAREKKIKDDEAAFAEREKRIKQQEDKAKRADIAAFVDGLVKAGRLLPRDQTAIVEFMAGIDADTVIEFTEGDEKKTAPRGQWLREFLGRLPQQVDYSERARASGGDTTRTVEFAAPHGYAVDPKRLELHNRALDYQTAHPNTSYEAALATVAR